ncbi:MAG: OmpA family protein [Planctomycetes bacterium]|nr:OmpA family protein [Planctomycetota bacterium]
MHCTARSRSLLASFALAISALLLPGCVARKDYDERLGEIRDQNELIRNLQAALDELEAEKREIERQLAAAGVDTESARKMREQLEADLAALRDLQKKWADKEAVPASFGEEDKGDWSVFQNQYGMGVRIKDDLLFPLGSAQLSDRGKEVLREIAATLDMQSRSERVLRVVGHTDNTPIVKPDTKAQYPYGNLQLSAQRAVVVADFLIEECQIPRARLGVEGYGDTRPLKENSSAENKASNRRCEIYIVDPTTAR